VAEVKNAPGTAREVEAKISEVPGIFEVSANPTTGNVLILFDQEKTDHFEILRHLSRNGYLAKSQDSRPKVGKAVTESLIQSAVQVALERLIFALV
jgi:copper chaperone CopZ